MLLILGIVVVFGMVLILARAGYRLGQPARDGVCLLQPARADCREIMGMYSSAVHYAEIVKISPYLTVWISFRVNLSRLRHPPSVSYP